MQRVLKYHVLLSEMIKLTSVDSADRIPLEEAKEAMQDINTYVNEVKRDYEMQQLVSAVEKSIPDLEMPEGMHLIDYGRLVKDGEIKIADHSKNGNKLKNRYVFIFDKVMLVCKSLRDNKYSYKSAHVLRDFRVEVDVDNNNKFGTLTRKLTANGGYYFSLVMELGDTVANVLNMCCKTLMQRENWVHNFETAQDNDMPRDAQSSGHNLQYHSYEKATICSHCQKFLAGLFFQGYHCSVCKKDLHRSCISMDKCTGLEPKAQVHSHPPYRRRHTSNIFQPSESVRAVQSFRSVDPRYLSFDKNDLIEIIQQNTDGTFTGRLVTSPDRIGLIQTEYVRKCRTSMTSLHNQLNGSLGGSILNGNGGGPMTPTESKSSVQLPRPITSLQRNSTVSTDSVMTSRTPPSSQDYINTDVVGQQWYIGSLERREAESCLRGTPDGTFLVRFSNPQQKYVVSISFNGDVKHTKVEHSADNRFYLDEITTFGSIVELINYYREHNLSESFETLDTTLRQAYIQNRPYVAIHNYEAPDPNFLELIKGQIVFVISRTGEERGWWKGRSGNKVGYFPLSYVTPVDQTTC